MIEDLSMGSGDNFGPSSREGCAVLIKVLGGYGGLKIVKLVLVCRVGDDSPRKSWSLLVLSSPYQQQQELVLVMLPSKHELVFVRRAVAYLHPPRPLATKHLRPLSKLLRWSRSVHLLPSLLLHLPLLLFAWVDI